MQNNAENKQVYKSDIYQEFISWSAMPPNERFKLHIMDQTDFAKAYNINKDTLTRWKNQPDFKSKVDKLRMEVGREKLSDIMYAIYLSAIKGNPKSQKLWMEYFTDFIPHKPGDKPKKPIVEMTEDDIRQIILYMPEYRHDQHFNAIQRIIDDAVFFRDHPETTEEEYNKINEDGL